MSKIKILQLPNPLLKQVCQQIKFPLTQQTQQNIQSLKNTFRQSFMEKKVRTLGLAAPQIGVLQRFFIMPKSLNLNGMSLQVLRSAVRSFKVFINPKILNYSENKVIIPQNCLSVGMEIYQVLRSESITVEYFNTSGERIQEKLSGMRARVFLHENDHLNGITLEQKGELMDKQKFLAYTNGPNKSLKQNQESL